MTTGIVSTRLKEIKQVRGLSRTIPNQMKEACNRRVQWAYKIYQYINQYVELKEVCMPILEDKLFGEALNERDIERFVRVVRKEWKLGSYPIENLIEELEEQGIILCKIQLENRRVKAFSKWYEDVPYIFLGTQQRSVFKRRFEVAHELGHLLLHPYLKKEEISSRRILTRIEKEADDFAAAFLMPAESFSKGVLHYSLDYFLMLEEKWKVPVKAIIYRSRQLGLISEGQSRDLSKQITDRQTQIRKNTAHHIELEEPSILMEAVNLLIEHNIVTPRELLEDLSLPKEEVILICNMAEDFFEEELSKQRKGVLRVVK